MKINNENEIYTLHFIFSYNYSTYQILWIHVVKNNIKITYHFMGDKKHDTRLYIKNNIFKYI